MKLKVLKVLLLLVLLVVVVLLLAVLLAMKMAGRWVVVGQQLIPMLG
jgi:hypothetical protein